MNFIFRGEESVEIIYGEMDCKLGLFKAITNFTD